MRFFIKYLWLVNIVFLTGFSYLVADLASLFIGQRLEVHPLLPPVESLLEASGQVKANPVTYSAIVDRNIFSSKPLGSLAQPEAAPFVPRTPLRIKLIGTIAGDPENSFAVIEDLATKEQHLYRLQDLVSEDGKLVAIRRNEVVLLREGGLEETFQIVIEETAPESKTPIARSQAPEPPQPSPAAPAAQTSFVLDKQEVTAALENLPQLLTKARVVPHLSAEGKNEGFRIVSIQPDSLYQRIGLQNGDVIQQINGIEVKDPETFMRVFNQLKNESNISLDLIRNNKKESFSYEIR
jgi:general secretion pathway protein C